MNTAINPQYSLPEPMGGSNAAALASANSVLDGPMVFAPDGLEPASANLPKPWEILVVDDEPDVHAATRFALRDFKLDGRPIAFVSASSAAEAIALMQTRQDIALILLDVVMETDHAGLDVVRFVRDGLKNKLVRIVLRTGHAGQSPERDVVIDYDINDYKDKADLTVQRLITCVVSALRSYRDLQQLEESRIALKRAQSDLQQALAAQERLVRERSDMLVQSEKLASVGQLAAGVALEINTPMAHVATNLSALRDDVGDVFRLLDATRAAVPELGAPLELRRLQKELNVDFLRKDIATLLQENVLGVERVRKIAQDLRDFSQVDRLKKWQWANLHRGLEVTISLLAPDLQAKGIVLVKAYGDIPDIECLPGELNQVFLALLLNAIQSIPGGTPAEVTVRTGCETNRVWVEVSDTGSGIAPVHLSRIFEPFFTTKPVGSGAGLGLSMAYGVVRKHGGEISATSMLGRGTTVRLTLPISRVAE
jgi:two-component system NtrC family sensor kinase